MNGSTVSRPPTKRCFVISPIGPESSEIRAHADDVFTHIIEHVLKPLDYLVERGDRIEEIGSIIGQFIRRIAEAQLVIADLTGANQNVFYELGVSHALRKATILLMRTGDKVPFDIGDQRIIEYTLNIRDAEQSRKRLADQVKRCEETGFKAGSSPMDFAIEMLSKSSRPDDNLTGALLEKIGELQAAMAALQGKGARERPDSLWDVLLMKQAEEKKIS